MYCQWMYRNKLIHVYIRTHHQHNTKICPVFFSTNISQGKHTSVNVETVVIGKKTLVHVHCIWSFCEYRNLLLVKCTGLMVYFKVLYYNPKPCKQFVTRKPQGIISDQLALNLDTKVRDYSWTFLFDLNTTCFTCYKVMQKFFFSHNV